MKNRTISPGLLRLAGKARLVLRREALWLRLNRVPRHMKGLAKVGYVLKIINTFAGGEAGVSIYKSEDRAIMRIPPDCWEYCDRPAVADRIALPRRKTFGQVPEGYGRKREALLAIGSEYRLKCLSGAGIIRTYSPMSNDPERRKNGVMHYHLGDCAVHRKAKRKERKETD